MRVTVAGSTVRLELRMAVVPTTGFPTSNCLTPAWTSTGTDNKVVDVVDFNAGGTYVGKNILVTGAAQDYCVTPGGTVWLKPAGAWVRPAGDQHVDFTVQRLDSAGAVLGITRIVRIGINGVPRLEVQG